MPVFPSVEWFQALAAIVNQDEDYRHQGTCDAVIGVQVDDRLFQITFEAYAVTDVREPGTTAPRDLDFTLSLPYERWKTMIENIKAHGRAEGDFTLNSIDLNSPQEFAIADDYYRRDLFYRFNQSFQIFFDAAAQVDTSFADVPAGT